MLYLRPTSRRYISARFIQPGLNMAIELNEVMNLPCKCLVRKAQDMRVALSVSALGKTQSTWRLAIFGGVSGRSVRAWRCFAPKLVY